MHVTFDKWMSKTNKHERKNITFEGPRFIHRDIYEMSGKAMQTEAYKVFDGWLLLNRIGDVVLFFRPHCIVEIGAGESSAVLAWLAQKHNVTFYSCDKKKAKGHIYNENHLFYQMMSDKFMKEFDDTPALVLIDGDHRYDQAKKEFEFFFERLIPGGVIFLHDSFPPHEIYLDEFGCGEVYKLRRELEQRTDEMDCLTFPYTGKWMGLTMVIKKDPERPWWGK